MNFTPPPPPLRFNRTRFSLHTHDIHPRASQVTLSRTVKIIHFIFFVSSFFPPILPHSSPLSTAAYKLSVLSACALLAFFLGAFFSSLLWWYASLRAVFSLHSIFGEWTSWNWRIVLCFPPPSEKTWKYFSFYIPNSRLFSSVGVVFFSAANNILSLRARQL